MSWIPEEASWHPELLSVIEELEEAEREIERRSEIEREAFMLRLRSRSGGVRPPEVIYNALVTLVLPRDALFREALEEAAGAGLPSGEGRKIFGKTVGEIKEARKEEILRGFSNFLYELARNFGIKYIPETPRHPILTRLLRLYTSSKYWAEKSKHIIRGRKRAAESTLAPHYELVGRERITVPADLRGEELREYIRRQLGVPEYYEIRVRRVAGVRGPEKVVEVEIRRPAFYTPGTYAIYPLGRRRRIYVLRERAAVPVPISALGSLAPLVENVIEAMSKAKTREERNATLAVKERVISSLNRYEPLLAELRKQLEVRSWEKVKIEDIRPSSQPGMVELVVSVYEPVYSRAPSRPHEERLPIARTRLVEEARAKLIEEIANAIASSIQQIALDRGLMGPYRVYAYIPPTKYEAMTSTMSPLIAKRVARARIEVPAEEREELLRSTRIYISAPAGSITLSLADVLPDDIKSRFIEGKIDLSMIRSALSAATRILSSGSASA